MSLTTNDALTPYEGPSRSRSSRSRGTVRVRDPAHGFFVAGSSLDPLNGIYGRVRPGHVQFLGAARSNRNGGCSLMESVRLCYRHDSTGWLMCLVDLTEEEMEEYDSGAEGEDEWDYYGYGRRKEPCSMQWRFIDESGNDRFRHKGDTIIPGAGTRWKHMKPPEVEPQEAATVTCTTSVEDSDSDAESVGDDEGSSAGKSPAELEDVRLDDEGNSAPSSSSSSAPAAPARSSSALVETNTEDDKEEDDEDELPWQVIALLDRSVLEDLRFSSAFRDEKVERALKGLDVEQPPEGSTMEGFLEAERREMGALTDGRAGMELEGEDGENEREREGAPSGWLYRVTAEEGVELYTAPPNNDSSGNDSDDEEMGAVVDDVPPIRRIVGRRSKDDYLRIVQVRGDWLRLGPSERPLRDPPLAEGDAVEVISGHYKGDRGEIVSEMDPESREFKVKLVGYTGSGSLHVSVLRRSGPIPGSREARKAALAREMEEARTRRADRRRRREEREREKAAIRQYYGDEYVGYLPRYLDVSDSSDEDTEDEAETLAARLFVDDDEVEDAYDDAYDGELWVAATQEGAGADAAPLLVRVPDRDVASLTIGAEREGADLFDRPFEPRLEDGDEEDGDDCVNAEEKEVSPTSIASRHPFASSATVPQPQCVNNSGDDDDDGAIPVGALVSLHGLNKGAHYNGRCGAIVAPSNADGRYGVRLCPLVEAGAGGNGGTAQAAAVEEDAAAGVGKRLLLRAENVVAVLEPEARSHFPLLSALSSSAEGADRVSRAARLMDVTLDAVGLGADFVEARDGRLILDAALRASDRDCHQLRNDRSSAAAACKMMEDELEETSKAHALLVRTAEKVATKEGSMTEDVGGGQSASALSRMAPHAVISAGYLGARARAAMAAAMDASNLDRAEGGLASLRGLLADEQARIFRQQSSGFVSSSTQKWKLERAEKDAAAAAAWASPSADDGAALTNDCLCLRLALVHALFGSRREKDAKAAADATCELYPQSAAAHLWRGRCLLRHGHRTEAWECVDRCVSLGPNGGLDAGGADIGAGATWAHAEGARRLRSLRRTRTLEFRARDSYERGNFKTAAELYGDMMREYDGDGGASDDAWGRAEALIARAACLRRDRNLESALADCDEALTLFPRYPRALFRRALCLLEAGRPKDALSAFERLLRVDRKWPRLLDWLVRAAAQVRRHEAHGTSGQGGAQNLDEDGAAETTSGNEDYYAVLGVSADATEAQLKRAYRLMSLKVHPDKPGGSAAAFHLVAAAFETLSDTEKRQLYDDGVDLSKKKKKKRKKDPYDDSSSSSESEDEDGNKKKSLREEIERKYFPENYKFWPFGDPFINKRRHQARKRKQAEQEKARRERASMRGGDRRARPWWEGHDDWDL